MIYFGGCSITMGAGFEGDKSDPRIYPNLIGHADNCAEGGSSNLKIFTRAAKALLDRRHQMYFVQWSALHRHWLYPRPDQGFYIGANSDHYVIDGKFVAQYQLLNHDYGNIMSLIDYTRILQQMADDAGRDIWFINGMVPWTEDMSTHDHPVSDYSRSLYIELDVPAREDFFLRMKNNLELVDWNQWINPWQSIMDLKQDNAPLDDHPGAMTHRKIADMIVERIDTL